MPVVSSMVFDPGNLPPELFFDIVSHLPPRQVFQLQRVSKRWLELLSSDATIKQALQHWQAPEGTTTEKLAIMKQHALAQPISQERIEMKPSQNCEITWHARFVLHEKRVVYLTEESIGEITLHILDLDSHFTQSYKNQYTRPVERVISGLFLASDAAGYWSDNDVFWVADKELQRFQMPFNCHSVMAHGSKIVAYFKHKVVPSDPQYGDLWIYDTVQKQASWLDLSSFTSSYDSRLLSLFLDDHINIVTIVADEEHDSSDGDDTDNSEDDDTDILSIDVDIQTFSYEGTKICERTLPWNLNTQELPWDDSGILRVINAGPGRYQVIVCVGILVITLILELDKIIGWRFNNDNQYSCWRDSEYVVGSDEIICRRIQSTAPCKLQSSLKGSFEISQLAINDYFMIAQEDSGCINDGCQGKCRHEDGCTNFNAAILNVLSFKDAGTMDWQWKPVHNKAVTTNRFMEENNFSTSWTT